MRDTERVRMTLDELEQLAKAAQKVHPGPWEGWVDSGSGPVWRTTGPGSYMPIVYEVNDIGGEELAKYIAAASPDVALGLIARVRELENAARYLFHGWAGAEGEEQPTRCIFGDAYMHPDSACYGAPREIQDTVRDIMGLRR